MVFTSSRLRKWPKGWVFTYHKKYFGNGKNTRSSQMRQFDFLLNKKCAKIMPFKIANYSTINSLKRNATINCCNYFMGCLQGLQSTKTCSRLILLRFHRWTNKDHSHVSFCTKFFMKSRDVNFDPFSLSCIATFANALNYYTKPISSSVSCSHFSIVNGKQLQTW